MLWRTHHHHRQGQSTLIFFRFPFPVPLFEFILLISDHNVLPPAHLSTLALLPQFAIAFLPLRFVCFCICLLPIWLYVASIEPALRPAYLSWPRVVQVRAGYSLFSPFIRVRLISQRISSFLHPFFPSAFLFCIATLSFIPGEMC